MHLVELIQRVDVKKRGEIKLYKIQLREVKLKSKINSGIIQFCTLCQYTDWQLRLINDIGGDASSMET